MRMLRYLYKILKLELFLVLTSLVLITSPLKRIEVQAIPLDDHPPLHYHTAHGKNLVVVDDVKTAIDLPSPKEKPHYASDTLLEPSGTSTSRLQPVVHETNKVILLTDGEYIKLYPLKESDLTPSGDYYVIQSKLNSTKEGWDRPLISHVGYLFNDKLCISHKQPRISKSDCLVLLWLDKRNKLFRYGSYMFTRSDHIQLLKSNTNSNLRPISDKNRKTIWLNERRPINLCDQLRERGFSHSNCDLSSLTVDKFSRITVSLNVSFLSDNNNQRSKKTTIAEMSLQLEGVSLDFQRADISFCAEKRGAPETIAMTANNLQCQNYWLNSNHELYSSDLDGQNVQLVEKLSTKPSLRTFGEMHSCRDILFFSDTTTKSIMSYNITKRSTSKDDHKKEKTAGSKRKFDVVHKLESTHQVLLMERLAINSFGIIDLNDKSSEIEDICRTSSDEPRVIDDNLSDHLRREKLYVDDEQHKIEDIMQMLLILFSILLIIFIVTKGTRVKQVKPDREIFVNHVDP